VLPQAEPARRPAKLDHIAFFNSLDLHRTSLESGDLQCIPGVSKMNICCHSICFHARVPPARPPAPWCLPRKALRGGISKSIFKRPCQFLAINAYTLAPRTSKRLQERAWDTPTKGLLWSHTTCFQSRLARHDSHTNRQLILYINMSKGYVHGFVGGIDFCKTTLKTLCVS